MTDSKITKELFYIIKKKGKEQYIGSPENVPGYAITIHIHDALRFFSRSGAIGAVRELERSTSLCFSDPLWEVLRMELVTEQTIAPI